MQKRWIKEDKETLRSTENNAITIQCNLEELEVDKEDLDLFPDGIEKVYLVFPAKNRTGIPNSPQIFSILEYGSLNEAHKNALKTVAKLKKLTIGLLENFSWSMID